MAVTRIRNNQITDSTITYQKIAAGTLVGSLFNSNITLNSNITIVGNLQVSGNTTTVNSIDTLINDPLVIFNNGFVGTPSYDIGFLVNRNLQTLGTYGGKNAAWIWREAEGTFEGILTTDTGTTSGSINKSFLANLTMGNITVANLLTAESARITTLSTTNFNPSGINASGNIVAGSGTFSVSPITGAIVVPNGGGIGIGGNLNVSGISNFTGNITAGNISLTGNINVTDGSGIAGNITISKNVYTTNGTQTAPSHSFASSKNSGMFWDGTYLKFSKAGTLAFIINDTGPYSLQPHQFVNGDVSDPAIKNGTWPGLGFYFPASGNIGVAAGSINVATFNSATASTSTTTGALRVSGGLGVAGNIHAVAINNTPIGNTTPSTGSFTNLSASTGFATNFSAANAIISSGYITGLANISADAGTLTTLNSTNGGITTLATTNFSTANARISGGYADNFPIGANTASTGNFTTANVATINAYTATVATVNATTGNVTTLTGTSINVAATTTTVLNSTNGNITTLAAGTTTTATLNTTSANVGTLFATNVGSGNVRIGGGYADNFPIGANTASTGNFTIATVNTVNAYTVNSSTTNVTNGNIGTLVVANIGSGNAIITGGNVNIQTSPSYTTTGYVVANQVNAYDAKFVNAAITAATISGGSINASIQTANLRVTGGYADNFPIGANTASTGNFTTANATTATAYTVNATTVNATNGNTTTLVASNFSTANARVSGGYADNFPIGANTASTGNFTTANAIIVYATTANTVNVNTFNANVGTLFATNVGSGNVLIGGGYADNFPIGANTASTGAFTTLTANGNLTVTSATDSINKDTGAVVVTGGVGIGGNLFVAGNLTVQGDFTRLNVAVLDVEDLNITVAKNSGSAAAANGAGLTVDGASASLIYVSSLDSWQLNKNLYGIDTTMVTANVTSANITSANIGSLTLAGGLTISNSTITSANITTLVATNFSTANARITGGYADNFPIGANIATTGNFTTANVNTATAYTVNAATTNTTNGNTTTLVAGNFSTANARITGGYADNFPIGANTASTGNFTTANTNTVNAYTVNSAILNVTNGNITTLATINFSTANARITGGYADNFPIGANTASTGNFTTVNSITANAATVNTYTLNAAATNVTNGNTTTLVTTNISTGNAVISGGYISALTNAYITTSMITNFSSGNILITGGYISALTNATIVTGNVESWYAGTLNATSGNITTGYFGSLNTANAVISGGYISALTNAYITTSRITNFSTGNAVVDAGVLNGVTIGNATAGYGKFTQLIASTSVDLSPTLGAATVTINPTNVGSIDNMNIGASAQGNAYVTNFRTTQSLWASTVNTVFIRAGQAGGSSINNIVIGSTDPVAGTFTTFNAQTVTAPTINTNAANISGALFATSLSTANAVISGGYISSLSNATITTGNVQSWYAVTLNASAANISGALFATSLNTANAVVTGGYINNLANVTASNATIGTINTSSANIAGNAIVSGNIVITSGDLTDYTNIPTKGAVIITGVGGAIVGGNTYIGGGAVVNGSKTANRGFYARGVQENSLLFVNPSNTYDSVSIGGNITFANIVQGVKLSINSNDAILIPAGSSANRPSGQGFTDVAGMIRYNTTTNQLEFYNGTIWQGTGSTFTLISDTQYELETGDIRGNVDGSNSTFVLPSITTTNGAIVNINGVLQLPASSYTVTGGTSLVFTEPPAIGDVIDVRILTTTATVSSVGAVNGFNYFQADNDFLSFFTGNALVGSNENWRIDTNGDFYPVTSSNIGAATNRIDYLFASNIDISGGTLTGVSLGGGSLDNTVIGGNIAALGAFTTLYSSTAFQANGSVLINSGNIQVDSAAGKYIAPSSTGSVASFDKTVSRGGEFLVSLSRIDSTEFQIAKVIIVQNGTTPYIETYGITYTGAANLATFSANISGSTVWLNASSAGANLQVKVSSTLMKV